MRGPTKARQICFELAKTKSKEQSYQEGNGDGERERGLKKGKESEQSVDEQRKKRSSAGGIRMFTKPTTQACRI
jgi:hypothetical protein